MYFGRNAYDPNAVSEAQTRLQDFRGATSISSNQYFGREEEDLAGPPVLPHEAGSLAHLEIAAKDAISRVLANPDVQNVGESIRNGALKVNNSSDYMKTRLLNTLPLPSFPITWHRYLKGEGHMDDSGLYSAVGFSMTCGRILLS